MMYRRVFVGGTFDGLHKGHEAVLLRAFEEGEKVTIGVTSDEFIIRYKSKILNPKSKTNPKSKVQITTTSFNERKHDIERWLGAHSYTSRARIIPIDDPYEPAASENFDPLIVTKDNKETGNEINRRRRIKGMSELALIEVPLVHAQDRSPISSSRVRNGEIDTNGRLIMPDFLIPELRKPLGKIIQAQDLKKVCEDRTIGFLITVGDMTTKHCLDAHLFPDLAIIDYKVGRKPFHDTINYVQLQKVKPFKAKRVKSGPGYISIQVRQAIREILARQGRRARQGRQERKESLLHSVIIVDGEEDLLALPAILYAPVGSVVLYGQPALRSTHQSISISGIVHINVSYHVKRKVRKLMEKFLVTE